MARIWLMTLTHNVIQNHRLCLDFLLMKTMAWEKKTTQKVLKDKNGPIDYSRQWYFGLADPNVLCVSVELMWRVIQSQPFPLQQGFTCLPECAWLSWRYITAYKYCANTLNIGFIWDGTIKRVNWTQCYCQHIVMFSSVWKLVASGWAYSVMDMDVKFCTSTCYFDRYCPQIGKEKHDKIHWGGSVFTIFMFNPYSSRAIMEVANMTILETIDSFFMALFYLSNHPGRKSTYWLQHCIPIRSKGT